MRTLAFQLGEQSIRLPFIDLLITINSPLTDTLVSGQLYLRTLFSIPVFTSQSNSVFTHSRKRTLSQADADTNLDFFIVYALS